VSSSFTVVAFSTAAAVVALLIAERAKARRRVAVAKTLASLGFLLAAWSAGALGSDYGRTILAGLCLCFFGDLLLIPDSRACFLAGLVSFLLGHLVFAGACVVRGVHWPAAAIAALILLGPAVVIVRWLLPHLDPKMRAPVLAYAAAITAMVALATGSVVDRPSSTLAAGALGFYLSDLSVARDRFVAPAFVNRAWGLPLYYAAQLLLAASVEAP
jgi:uncharacterized membrane protein YhhN